MGNKQGKLEKKESKRKGKNARGDDDHSREVVDGPTTSPFTRSYRGDQRPGMRMYHSYAGTGNGSHTIQRPPPVEVKLLRHSNAPTPTGGRYQSLPRTTANGRVMGRSRSVTSSIYLSNGTLNQDPSMDHSSSHRYSMVPAFRGGLGLNDTRDSIRSTSTYASNYHQPGGTNYRVVTDDFPDTSAIKRRLTQFETQFAKVFAALYSRLSETVQLSAISIALRRGQAGQHPISLYQYLTSDEIPADLSSAQAGRSPLQDQFLLTIPPAMFHGVKHVRSEAVPDRRHWISLARELVNCLAVEVGEEISRIFEYQIAMLGDGLPIDLLGSHAAQSAIEYLKMGNRFLDRNTMIAGVLSGGTRTQDPNNTKIISVVIGEKELKWNVAQIFQRCGMRKEALLFYPKVQDAPWTFYSSRECNPLVYGYRGIVLDRDPVEGYYIINREDEVRFTQEAEWSQDDIHRRYVPYRRLIGKEVMDNFCSVTKDNENSTLADYVMRLQGSEFSRDIIQPVYRPLGMVSALPNRSRLASSASSLLSYDSATNRALGRSSGTKYPTLRQIQVTSTVVMRNTPTPTPPSNGVYNGHFQGHPPTRRFSPDTCSIPGDVGYGRVAPREVPASFGHPRFRNSTTYVRPDLHQPRRLYQSHRYPATRSVSSFDHHVTGPVAREISSPPPPPPTAPASNNFLDFNAFLGMIKQNDSKANPEEAVNGHDGGSTSSPVQSPMYKEEIYTMQMNGHSPRQVNGHSTENDLRRTAISHV